MTNGISSAGCVVSSGAGGGWTAAPFGVRDIERWAVTVTVRVTRVVRVVTAWVVCSGGLLEDTIAVYISVPELSAGTAGMLASGGLLGATIAVYIWELFAGTEEFAIFPPQLKSPILG